MFESVNILYITNSRANIPSLSFYSLFESIGYKRFLSIKLNNCYNPGQNIWDKF